MARRGGTTTLTLQLIDGVSKPARLVQNSLRTLNTAISGVKGGAMAPARAVAALGRSARQSSQDMMVLGGAASLALTKGAREVYDLEKQLNISVAAGNLTLQQRAEFLAYASKLNADYAGSTADIVAGGNELLKSGFNYEQMSGSLTGILNTAQAMDVPVAEASAAIVQAMVSQKMAMGDRDEAMASSIKMADLYAHAMNETAGANLEDFRTSGKYFNSIATAIGMSADQTMAWQIALAKAGIYGSSAGTGLRSAPVSLAAPTKKGREAFGRLGIDPTQFTGNKVSNATGSSIAGALSAAGIDAEGIDDQIDQIIKNSKFKGAPAKLANAIINGLGDQLELATAEDRSMVSDVIQRAITAGISEIDMLGILRAMKAANAQIGDYKDVFGGNHASKMMAIDTDSFQSIMDDIIRNADGTAERMRKQMMAGIVGDVAELDASITNLYVSIGQAGLLADAARAFKALSISIDDLARSNPALLKFGAYSLIALAAMAPLGFAISGLAAMLALAANPITWVVGGLAALATINLTPIVNGMKAFGWGFSFALKPELVERLRATGNGMRDFLSSFKMGDWDLLKVASSAGAGMARGINALYEAAPLLDQVKPRLQAFGEQVMAFGNETMARVAPQIQSGKESLQGLFDTFVSGKVDAVVRLGGALKVFGENALAGLSPSVGSAIDMVATSFNTLVAGGETVVTLLESARGGFVNFASGLLEAISPGALTSIGNGMTSLFEMVAGPVTSLGDGFREITAMVSGSTDSINMFASSAGTKVGEAINWIVTDLSNGKQTILNAWEGIKSLFTDMGNYAPSFGPLIGAIQSAIGTIVNVIGRVADAVSSAKTAISNLAASGGAGAAAGAAIGTAGASARSGPIPARASGGSVRRGPVLVGERGPELVHMGGNGYVTPNHKLPAPAMGPVTIHVSGAGDPRAVAREVGRQFDRRISRSGQTGIGRD